MNEQVRPTTEEPETKPRGVSRRWFAGALAVLTGTGAAMYAGLRPKVSLAAPEATPPPKENEYEKALSTFVDEAIEAAKSDNEIHTGKNSEEQDISVSNAQLLEHVTHWAHIKEIISYFIDTSMVSPKVENPDSLEPDEVVAKKVEIFEKQKANWGSGFTARMAVVVNEVIEEFNNSQNASHSPEQSATNQQFAIDRSQLRKLMLYIIDVRNGNQPDLPEFRKQIEDVLVYSFYFTEQMVHVFMRATEEKYDALPEVKTNSGTFRFNIKGLIGFINDQKFAEYKIEDYQDKEPISRRTLFEELFESIFKAKSRSEKFRESVIRDLTHTK